MSFFKKILQSVLNEEDGNKDLLAEKTFVEVIKPKTSKIVDKLEKGNNGVFGDEYEAEDKLIQDLLDSTNDLILEEEDDDDSSNYRDKDLEAKKAYIEKMKKKSLLKAEHLAEQFKKSKKSGAKGDGGKKSGTKGDSGKKGDWGKRTSERNLHREIGGMERDYARELKEELLMRSNNRKQLRKILEALRIVIRRRLKRMHITRGIFSRFRRSMLNLRKLKTNLRKIGCVLKTRSINKIRNIKISKIKAMTKKINKTKKMAKAKRMMYYRAKQEDKQKYLQEYKKLQKNVSKQQKASRNMGISM